MEESLSRWVSELLTEENRVYRAAMLEDESAHREARSRLLRSRFLDPSGFEAYLPYSHASQRNDPRLRANREASTPRTLSLVRTHPEPGGGHVHRLYLDRYQGRGPGRIYWKDCFYVRQGSELRVVATYFPCDRCEYTGQAGTFRCHYCDGTRWIHLCGQRIDVRGLPKATAVDRFAPPVEEAHVADYASVNGFPPIDLPLDPNAAE